MAKRRKNYGVTLRPGELTAVAAATRTWYIGNRQVPTLDQLDSICSIPRNRITKVLMTEEYLLAMDDAGIPVRKQKGLTAKQHYALMIMTDPNDKRAHHIRMKEAAISTSEWRAWLKNPVFNSFLETFMENALGDHMNAAHLSLMNAVDRGDVAGLKLYYAMTGRYSENSQQERDVQAVLAGVIEILQRNVSDMGVLSKIADEIRALMGGKKELTAYRSEQIEDAVFEEINEKQVPDPTGPLIEFEVLRKEKYQSEGWTIEDKEAFLEKGGAAVSFDEGDIFKDAFYDRSKLNKTE